VAKAHGVRRTKRRLLVRFGVAAPEATGYTRNVSRTGLWIVARDQVFEMWAFVVWAKRYPPALAQFHRGSMGCRFFLPSSEWLDFYDRWKDEL
jgi:hypothetical protein